MFTPGVVHFASVPAHRKVNRVDMGTADKVCAAALAIHEQAERRRCREREVSFILLELGGAFTAAIAVDRGAIVDGAGGSSGPLGLRGAGALDGEVAFLAGSVSKGLLFGGGAATIAGPPDAPRSGDRRPAHAARPPRMGGVPRERRQGCGGTRRVRAWRARGDPVRPDGARAGGARRAGETARRASATRPSTC